ncbi:30S ribosomal protein S8 [Candidatus Woesearchaeota archaeon]|nr:30S ribosomal protein S8 [Candidatus Woesearchaeota archaeon]MBW3006059.1 30S ribosomal protein S8 [Candidatus Woesearchaeota archaeon]
MNNDPLANALSATLNYELAGKKEIMISPTSKVILGVLKILNAHQYVGQFETITDARGGYIKLHLLGNLNKCGVIKPRFSVGWQDFDKFEKRYLPAKGMGIIIISTNKGLMTLDEAREKQIGGKLIAYCY